MRISNAIRRIVKNGCLWLYYSFCKEYARIPSDLEDLCDGILCLRAMEEARKIAEETNG